MRPIVLLLPLAACALPVDDWDSDGWTAQDGDCDDFDDTVHPEAPDREADGIDQDCDGIDPLVRGEAHTCALAEHGEIVCTGDNSYGQLEIPNGNRVWIQLAAGDYHTCALDVDHRVTCWGDDRFGQASPPIAGPFVSIDAGASYSIGILDRSPALCWGLCFGRL